MRNEEDLEILFDKSKNVLYSLGYNVPGELIVRLNYRLKTCLGQYFSNGIIEINKKHFLYDTEDNVINTMIHELIHAMYPNYLGHCGKWEEAANHVSENTRYKIQAYAQKRDYEFMKNVSNIRPASKMMYKMVCDNCGCRREMLSIYDDKDVSSVKCKWCKTRLRLVEKKKVYKYL